jgi:antitoxin component of MazEF toxin-antitoxin module
MIESNAQVREWGRSVGIVIPKDIVIKEKIKVGDNVTILIKKKGNPLKETFGILKFDKKTEDILKEIDKEGWDKTCQ